MTDEQILNQIKHYPILYDTRASQYRDLDARNIVWEEIARKVNSNVEDVKVQWGKLRNCYTNALKRRYRKNSHDANKITPWKFEKQMEFLIPHLKYRNFQKKKTTDVEIIVESLKDESLFNEEFVSQFERPVSPAFSSPNEEDTGNCTPTSIQQHRNIDGNLFKKFVNMINTSNDLNERRVSAEMDENDHFFLSMSKLIKRLPQKDQVDIKFELHKLIYEAEKRRLQINITY